VTQRHQPAVLTLLAAATLVFAACSSTPAASTPAASAPPASVAAAPPSISPTGSAQVASTEPSSAVDPNTAAADAAKAAIQPYLSVPSVFNGPTSGPKPEPGKKIMVLSCSQATACAQDAAVIVQGAKDIGWNAYIQDGKGDPATWNAQIRAAVTAKVDGIIDVAIPPALVTDALRFAQSHNVPLINEGEFVYATHPLYYADTTIDWKGTALIAAQWIVADSNGTANVVIFRDDEFTGVKYRMDVIADYFKTSCPGCTVLDQVSLVLNDVTTPRMASVLKAEIDRFGSKLQYIITPYDAAEGFVIPELKTAGRTDIKDVGFVGGAQQCAYLHQGQMSAISSLPSSGLGFSAVNELVRFFGGLQPDVETPPLFLATQATAPATGNCELLNFDVEAAYKKVWGVP
jgi:ribose transport system substrate-binding protein